MKKSVVLLVYFVLIDKGGMKRTNKQKTRKENKTLEIRKETFVFVCVCVSLSIFFPPFHLTALFPPV